MRKFLVLFSIFIAVFVDAKTKVIKKENITAYYSDKGELIKVEQDSNGDKEKDIIKFLKKGEIYKIKQDADFDGFFETLIFIDKGNINEADYFSFKTGNLIKKVIFKKGKISKVFKDFEKGKFLTVVYYKNGKKVKKESGDEIDYFDSSGNVVKVEKKGNSFFYEKGKIVKAIIRKQRKISKMILFRNGYKSLEKDDLNLDGFFEKILYFKKGRLYKTEFLKKGCRFPVRVELRENVFIDENCNGVFEKSKLGAEIAVDANEDGFPEKIYFYKSKKLSKVQLDTNNDKRYDEIYHYKKGKLLKAEKDTDFNGKPDLWLFYGNGEVVKTLKDLDGDGKADMEE